MSATSATALGKPTTTTLVPGPTTSAKVVRALVWLLLGAAVVRAIGAGVGAWAAGSLGVLSTLLVGLVLPAWLLVYLPTWLAWRVLRPLRCRRAVRTCLWLSPLASSRDLESIEVFLEVLAGRPLPAPDGRPADAWIALAAALQAEQQGDRARADRILDAFTHLPEGCRVPLLARSLGVESLAWTAFARGDWALLLRYARLGDGRLVRSLSLLARAELGEPIRPGWILLQWALAPKRLATLARLRKAIARPSNPPQPIPPPVPPNFAPKEAAAVLDPRLRHLLLLAAAARGESIQMREVLSLAEAWTMQLDGAAMAQLQARALELGARVGDQQIAALREIVIEELILLGLAAQGPLPPSPVEELLPPPGTESKRPLANEVVARIRERLFEAVHAALRGLAAPRDASTVDALASWERWLLLRSALDRLESRAGEQAVTTLWHSDVRNTVWSFACALFDRRHVRTAWAAHMVFAWLALRAECLNDVQAMLLNRENARIAQRTAA